MNEYALTETERNVLARYFGLGKSCEIISHPPHATIGLHRHAFERLLALGLLIEAPFNQFGVKRITCTEEAAQIGFERMQENMQAITADDSPVTRPKCTWPDCDQPSGHDYCYEHCVDNAGPTVPRPERGGVAQ